MNNILTKLDGSDGFRNKHNTSKLIHQIDSIKPQLVHLHILHGHYINVPMLFDYLAKNRIKTVWTFHDCWGFTGKCAFFQYINCYDWKENSCRKCNHLKEYPQSFLINKTKFFLKTKKRIYSKMNKLLTVVCVSEWLKKCADESRLFKNLQVIYNGINLSSEYSEEYDEELKQKFSKLKFEKMIFSAAYPFDERKGLNIIIDIAQQLPNYVFVIAGLTKKQSLNLPNNVLSIGKVNGKEKMNTLYRNADCFLNTSLDDTFGLVNVESHLNGTPVVAFDIGPFKEIIREGTGFLVEPINKKKLIDALTSIKKDTKTEFLCKDNAKRFSKERMCEEYLLLFKNRLSSKQ